ncbi:MAG: AMIN domain-containing protein, partial [Desulfatiglandaceae bacterium]
MRIKRATYLRLRRDMPYLSPCRVAVLRHGVVICLALLYMSFMVPLAAASSPTVHAPVEVTRLTWASNSKGIEAVVYLSGQIPFSENRLKDPERFYIDLKNAAMGSALERHYPVNEPLLKTIRVGQFDRKTVRIVFDLGADNVRPHAAFLDNPHRIRVRIHAILEKEVTPHRSPVLRSEGLIPKNQWITDVEARLALARVLAYDNATLDESLNQYRILLHEKPDDPLIRLEMAGVLIQKGGTSEALSLLKDLQGMSLDDSETLVVLADLEAGLGHSVRCRDLYLEAIQKSDNPETIRLKLANRMNMWGDFYRAEAIYRERLHAHPDDTETALQLAAVLRSSERYAESEGIYKELLAASLDPGKVLLEFARLKRLEKKAAAAEEWVEQFIDRHPDDPEGLLLKADILFFQKRFEEALGIYSRLSNMTCCRVQGLLGMGKVYLEQGKSDLTQACFVRAHELEPRNVEVRYYLAGPNTATSDDFVNAQVKDRRNSAITLEKWARLYAEEGYNKIAIQCYEASLERDPDYFPSQIGLAEVLAIDHQYDRAVERFETLSQVFPDNRKILMGWARTLGWGRRYDQSIALYDKIHAMAPSDPVPRME